MRLLTRLSRRWAEQVSSPRIIGGAAKGRRLDTPKKGTRPSPARLREAFFNIIEFRERGRFLDLYSGSGAVGLEAASRGWQAVCVDLSAEAAAVIRKNARTLNLDAEIIKGDALKYASGASGFDIVFAAPPYPLNLPDIFQNILTAAPAAEGGLYVFQHPTNFNLHLTYQGQLALPDKRKYGSNALSLLGA